MTYLTFVIYPSIKLCRYLPYMFKKRREESVLLEEKDNTILFFIFFDFIRIIDRKKKRKRERGRKNRLLPFPIQIKRPREASETPLARISVMLKRILRILSFVPLVYNKISIQRIFKHSFDLFLSYYYYSSFVKRCFKRVVPAND